MSFAESVLPNSSLVGYVKKFGHSTTENYKETTNHQYGQEEQQSELLLLESWSVLFQTTRL